MKNEHVISRVENLIGSFSKDVCIEKSKNHLSVPSHRKSKRFNTIDEYVKFIKENKWTTLEFKKNGYCDDQISCFNFILKGKLTLTKEAFIEEYYNKLTPLREIEKKYSIPYGCITFIREYYGIKRVGSTGLKRRSEEKHLNEIQKQILYGCLLGDASRLSNAIRFKQSICHKDYLSHLLSIFKEHCSENNYHQSVSYDDRYDSKSIVVSFYTRNHRQIKSICDEFYIDDKKTINIDILNKLTPLSVAYWFMDDGSSEINRNGNSGSFCSLGNSKIYTCSFTYNENLLIKDWFKERFGIKCVVKFKKENSNPYLFFYANEAEKLRSLIRPYVVDCMSYKISFDKAVEKYKANNDLFDLSKLPARESFMCLTDENKIRITDVVFNYYRKTGFPYIQLDDESINLSFERILNWKKRHLYKDDGKTIKNNTNSTNIIWNFQKHMFGMCSLGSLSPIQIFSDDNLFRMAINKCLENIGCCSSSNIRSVLRDFRGNKGVSSMPPSVAKAVYMYFDKQLSVLDFSAGFGGRLLGSMTSENVKRYVCIDSLKETCDGLQAIYDKFKDVSYPSVSIIHGSSECALDLIDETFDLVFTSPPFFDKETYSKDKEQSCVKYSSYQDWFDNWLMVVVDKSTSKLKKNGKLVIWIGHSDSHNITEDFLVRSSNILSLDDVLYFEMAKSAYNRNKNSPLKLEKFLIMSRK